MLKVFANAKTGVTTYFEINRCGWGNAPAGCVGCSYSVLDGTAHTDSIRFYLSTDDLLEDLKKYEDVEEAI